MSAFGEFVIKNNRVMAPVISILVSVVLVFGSLFVSSILVLFVPIATFIVMHYSKLYRIWPTRILGSLVIFLVVSVSAGAIFANATFGLSQAPVADTTSIGTITTYVTPFAGVSPSHNFTMVYDTSSSVDVNLLNPMINITDGSTRTVILKNQINVYSSMAGSTHEYMFSYIDTSLTQGIYTYNFSLNNTLYISNGQGPLYTNQFRYFEAITPEYVISYMVIFEIVFLIGVFLGRSIANSKRFDPKKNDK
ncbi:MAG: hypothetical protein QW597_03920 [Thermoplasmataceae archaeon]